MIEEKKGDKTYLKFDGGKLTLEPKLIVFHFENLFNGDKLLGENLNKAINEGYKEIYADIRDGYEAAFSLVFQGLLNGFFSKVSNEDAFE